jgi:hypothetical protein
MSALVWFRGPFFGDCTSGAMYNLVPTSAECNKIMRMTRKTYEDVTNEPSVISASVVTAGGASSDGSTAAARLDVARPKSPTSDRSSTQGLISGPDNLPLQSPLPSGIKNQYVVVMRITVIVPIKMFVSLISL